MPRPLRFAGEPQGLELTGARPLVYPLSLVRAGSAHRLLLPSVYQIWGTQPMLIYFTNAANDPPVDPTTQNLGLAEPLEYVPLGFIFETHFTGQRVTSATYGNFTPTGFRAVALNGLAGTVYVNNNRRAR